MNAFYTISYFIHFAWFLTRTVFHLKYRVVVFLSKPGATFLVYTSCYVVVFWIHYAVSGLPHYNEGAGLVDLFWQGFDWLQYDRIEKGNWFYVDVPLLMIGTACHILPRKLLVQGLGMFPAMQKPLPPLRRLTPPRFKIRTYKVRRVGMPAGRSVRRSVSSRFLRDYCIEPSVKRILSKVN